MEKFHLKDIDIYRVLSSMHEGVVISDTEGVVRFFNETQARIDDIDPKDAIGKKITDIYKLTNDTSPTMRCLCSGAPVINEPMLYQTRLGRVANIISNAYPLYKSGKLIGAINFSKDYQLLEKIIVQDKTLPETKERESSARFCFADIIGSDPDILNSARIAMMACNTPSPIMICGETGTGKELFAQSIHNHSLRAKKPFIPINCTAIPETLLEGILFGTSKGSFTGAIEKNGLFVQANGGSIFLDELDSMPLTLQAKLLRVIQEKKVRKLGSLKEIDLDVKIISSVARPPLETIQSGALRMDLYYRMGVVPVILPPLRKRKGDLNELIHHFIAKYNQRLQTQVLDISKNVSGLFGEYHWPGNVRELEHIIEAAMNLIGREKTIRLKHLPPHIFAFSGQDMSGRNLIKQGTAAGPSRDLLFSDLSSAQNKNERLMISNALRSASGNAAKAAKSLGVSPQSFHYKLKKHGLKRKDFSSL